MEKEKFQKAIDLNNMKNHLMRVKNVMSGGLLELQDSAKNSVTIQYPLLKKLNEVIDKEIAEINKKIEEL